MHTPDLYIPEKDLYVEIKSWWTESAKEKIRLFREEFPEINLEIIGPEEYNGLVEAYSQLSNWEKT